MSLYRYKVLYDALRRSIAEDGSIGNRARRGILDRAGREAGAALSPPP